jgi:Protein of unknown function (DUF2721)
MRLLSELGELNPIEVVLIPMGIVTITHAFSLNLQTDKETELNTVVGWFTIRRSELHKMEITITTPALLFPAISLLMISYTTRFLHLAHLARSLHAINPDAPEPTVLEQIKNIRKRILLIRNMQATGISSLLLCIICMCLLFEGQVHIAQALFIASLALMSVSLLFSLGEIWISVDALNVHLRGIAEGKNLSPY